MASRKAAFIWLLMGLFMGLVTLSMMAFGGYAVWHTHNNVELVERRIEADDRELNQLKTRFNAPGQVDRFKELDDRLIASSKELNDVRQDRFYAIAILISSIVPALMTLPFLTMFLVKWMKSRAAPNEDDTEEEAPEEPRPPKKSKTTNDAAE